MRGGGFRRDITEAGGIFFIYRTYLSLVRKQLQYTCTCINVFFLDFQIQSNTFETEVNNGNDKIIGLHD